MSTRTLDRRQFLHRMGLAGFYLSTGSLVACDSDGVLLPASPAPAVAAPAPVAMPAPSAPAPTPAPTRRVSNLANLGPLEPPNEFKVRLPKGFTMREVAREGVPPVAGQSYVWHHKPDGGVVFPAPDGGWVYVSNSEVNTPGGGGVGALRFNAAGDLVDAYPILTGTIKNCAGGPTPWGTWISCEETARGYAWECNPFGSASEARKLNALGKFQHEGAAIDPLASPMHVYLTEDQRNDSETQTLGGGLFYRFVPAAVLADGRPDLTRGTLQAASVTGTDIYSARRVTWHAVPDPEPMDDDTTGDTLVPTRFQLPQCTPFDGGEGIWYHEKKIYFSTKGDDRVWCYDIDAATIQAIYDAATSPDNILHGVDNVVVAPGGEILVCEDPGDGQIVALTPDGAQVAILQLLESGEPAGPAFTPDGKRLYFSGYSSASGPQRDRRGGATFEITGPFFVDVPA